MRAVRVFGALTLLAASGLSLSPAFGADGTGDNWTGLYAGGQIGLLALKAHAKGTAIPAGETLLGDIGGNAGAFAGFYFQPSNWIVWGLDLEANLAATELLYNGKVFGAMKWDGAVRAIAGVPVAPNVLAFASVGYSWAHFDLSPYYSAAGFSGQVYTGGGPQLGLGVDVKLTDHMKARLHATWAHYGVHTITNGGVASDTSEPSLVNVRLGVAWSY